jgi:carbonic anhydrase
MARSSPRTRAAIITAMDGRLVGLLEGALGVTRGDVIEIKLASPTIREGEELDSEVIRSLVTAVYLLGVREVIVIGSGNSSASPIDGRAVVASMRALGVNPEALPAYRASSVDGLMRWLGSAEDAPAHVAQVAARIRSHPYIPRLVAVHALVMDPQSGALEVVARDDNATLGN